MAATRLHLFALAASAGLFACLSVPRPTAPDLYALDPALAAEEPSPGAARIPIVIGAPRPAPGLEGLGMLYVPREHEVRYFARSAWVDTPGRMLEPLLGRALEATGAFEVIEDAPSDPRAHLRLETELRNLEQEFTRHPSQVRLALRVRLVDSVAHRILGDREFVAVEPAPTDDPYGGVVAANRAASLALKDVAAACRAWVSVAASP
ncbi:MAG TPA: ABC-type transport auxiliary lipoprotein family protein [Anaeromyxobacteraceae bacterium]|nr:ABC-type transport auxiliary lipoprotein family protein [Anaeromyxobacteraceae bacterium]